MRFCKSCYAFVCVRHQGPMPAEANVTNFTKMTTTTNPKRIVCRCEHCKEPYLFSAGMIGKYAKCRHCECPFKIRKHIEASDGKPALADQKQIPISVKLPADLVTALMREPDVSKTVEQAVRRWQQDRG